MSNEIPLCLSAIAVVKNKPQRSQRSHEGTIKTKEDKNNEEKMSF